MSAARESASTEETRAAVRKGLRTLRDSDRELVHTAVPLSGLTTFKIGGPALCVCRIQNPEAAHRFQDFAQAQDLPLYVLGAGSNVLARDDGFSGLILKMEIDTFRCRAGRVTVGAGLWFDDLIRRSLEAGLVGLEFASGIPGTVGGAIAGNAGCYGHEISEFLTRATVLRADGRIETVGPRDLGFGSRHSRLKESGDLLLEAELRLEAAPTDRAWLDRQEKLASRRRKHPQQQPCAGSYFQNLPPAQPGGRRRAAGELLDQVGAKGFRVGDAAVYAKHANIIVNTGSATCGEVLDLAARMKAAVSRRFKVNLEEEVRLLGDGSSTLT